jgi:RND family efflux transporter MFP subunit
MRQHPCRSSALWPFFRATPLALLLALAAGGRADAGEFLVQPKTVQDMKAMFGQVESRDIVAARARIGGTIMSRSVDEGTQVKAGDVVAVVADEKLALQAQSLDGQLRALDSQLTNAKTAFERAKSLMAGGYTTQAAFDQAKTNLDVLQHQLESARSQRAVIAQQTDEGKILAPKAGRVLTVAIVPGSVIMPGEAVARIASGATFLRLSLPERHAALLRLDAPVSVAPRRLGAADGGNARQGRIAKIYPEIENGRVIADAEVEGLTDFFVGERVQVHAPVGERQALLLPRAAVATRSGVDYVRVLRPEGALDVAVVVADAHQGDMVEALTGLNAGDKVETP